MKPNAQRSAATRESTPPLRSTTVTRSPASNRSTSTGAKAGFDTIKLDTYHDSSDLKAALRALEAAFAVPANAAATPAPSPQSGTTNASARHPENSTQSGRGSSSAKPTITVVGRTGVPAASSSASASATPPLPPARRTKAGPSLLLQLPPQLLLRCFAFCDLPALGVLCRVSVRLNVMIEQQGNALWAEAALRHRVPVANAAVARGELRRALEAQATARNAEEAFYESEIARMEERLRVRAADVYAQNVDVNRTIATGGVDNGTVSTPQPYWMRSQRAPDRSSDTGARAATTEDKNSMASQLCTKLRSEVEALEAARRTWESKVSLQGESLREQAAQLRQWQWLLFPSSNNVAAPTSSSEANASVGKAAGENATSAPLISAAQLERFERRITRLVLNGATTTAALTIGEAGGDADGLPLVLRRGVEDFAAVELVLRALGAHPGIDAGGPPSSEVAHGDSAAGSERRVSAEARDAGRRWRAFQRMFPLNEDYESVRCYVVAQELRGLVPHAAAGGDGGGGRPSTKQTPALLRVSGFVRRVEGMTDSQVVQAFM